MGIRMSFLLPMYVIALAAGLSAAHSKHGGKHCKAHQGHGHHGNTATVPVDGHHWHPKDQDPTNARSKLCCQWATEGKKDHEFRVCHLIRKTEICENEAPLPADWSHHHGGRNHTRAPKPSYTWSTNASNSHSTFITSSVPGSSSQPHFGSTTSISASISSPVSTAQSQIETSMSIPDPSTVLPSSTPHSEPTSSEETQPTSSSSEPEPTSSEETQPTSSSTGPEPTSSIPEPEPEPTSSFTSSSTAPEPTQPACVPSGETCRFDDPGACCTLCCISTANGPVCCNQWWK